ncbi:MAG TPA: SgcJ/EcaC family oxidoreductase [Candidatus Saccharimonadales bacterium]|nr:SgcJ/EcaC family oxidoreductase [Candidatus Saccharimonadales bacterium]
MRTTDDDDSVQAALDRFDRTFASGDAAGLTALFAPDARLLLLHAEAMDGRPAILAHWTRVFDAWDPGEWQAERQLLEVHGDRAYALSTYAETLRERAGSASIEVHGRLIHFLRREPDGTWLVTVAMNSHSRPTVRTEEGPAEPRHRIDTAAT